MSTSRTGPGAPDGDDGGPADSSAGPPALADAVVRLGLESSLLLHAAADRMGMAVTDLSCVLLLLLEGPASAGRLAGRTGLTTGAITGVVDRLVRAGWADRQPDVGDRRRVVVRLADDRVGSVWAALGPVLSAAGLDEPAGEGPPSLAAVLARVTAALGSARERLRSPTGPLGLPGLPPPRAVLRLLAWSGRLQLQPADLGEDLVAHGAAAPGGGSRWGRATVAPAGGRHRDVPLLGPVFLVNGAVAWEVEISGGADRIELDLRAVDLAGLVIGGGVNRMDLHLPRPTATVPLRIGGGANRLRITRPPGTAVVVRAAGGAGDIRIDGVRIPVGPDRTWGGGPASGEGADRYELEVSGGVSKLVIE